MKSAETQNRLPSDSLAGRSYPQTFHKAMTKLVALVSADQAILKVSDMKRTQSTVHLLAILILPFHSV